MGIVHPRSVSPSGPARLQAITRNNNVFSVAILAQGPTFSVNCHRVVIGRPWPPSPSSFGSNWPGTTRLFPFVTLVLFITRSVQHGCNWGKGSSIKAASA